MDVILFRHGQSQWNLDQTGGADAPLTALGRTQAARAGLYCVSQFKLRALYASTYQRAYGTADIINSFVKLERVIRLDELREFDEEYSGGMPRFESPFAALQIESLIRPRDISAYYDSFQQRVARGLQIILDAHADLYDTNEQIGIVSHGGTMGTMMRLLTGNHHFSFDTENTGIHILRWKEQRWHILAVNRTEHLECSKWHHEAGKDA